MLLFLVKLVDSCNSFLGYVLIYCRKVAIRVSKILDYLLQDDVIVVFDVDGVLCPFEFGNLKHNACKDSCWESFVVKNKPYSKAKAIPQMKQFIEQKGIEKVFVCSVAEPLEEKDKKNFLIREYGIFENHISFVRSSKSKLKYLQTFVTDGREQNQIALVDDTVEILNDVYEQSDFITVHVSSFFSFSADRNFLINS